MKHSFSFLPRFALMRVLFLGLPLLLLAAPLCEVTAATTGYQKSLLRLHNKERAKRNRPKLRLKAALNRSAVGYAIVMNDNNHFDHVGPAPGFTTFDQRINAECAGCFTTMAENIAFGQPSVASVNLAWMKSPGHRRNILHRNFRFVGFGKAGASPYWVANFGG